MDGNKRSNMQNGAGYFRGSLQMSTLPNDKQSPLCGNGKGECTLGQCTLCCKPSVCICQRCGDYYCSPNCQRKDWPRHRYICFPMPPLVYPPCFDVDSVFGKEVPNLVAECMQKPFLNSSDSMCSKDQSPKQQQQQQPQANKSVNQKNKASKGKEPKAVMPASSPPNSNTCVVVTGFRSPNRCFVRSLSDADNGKHMLAARKIDAYGKTAPVLRKLPAAHSYVITEMEGVMYRGEVLQARSMSGIRVLLCDRGVIVVRSLNELREISDEIIRLPQCAIMVSLRSVSNYMLNDNLMKFLMGFEDSEFKIKYYGDEVELLHWQTNKSLNEQITDFCQKNGVNVYPDTTRARENTTKTSEAASEAEDKDGTAMHKLDTAKIHHLNSNSSASPSTKHMPVMEAPFRTHLFKAGVAPFKAIILDDSCFQYGYLGCIAASDLEHLKTVIKQLKSYKDTNEPYKPKKDEYCLAKFEDQWYRAKVDDIPDDTHYSVTYIDFMNEASLTSEDIRYFPADLTQDCRTTLCEIIDFPTLSAEEIEYLKHRGHLDELMIDCVQEVREEVAVVECRNLLKEISKMKSSRID